MEIIYMNEINLYYFSFLDFYYYLRTWINIHRHVYFYIFFRSLFNDISLAKIAVEITTWNRKS